MSQIEISDDVSRHDEAALEDAINRYNFETTNIRDGRRLSIIIRSRAGDLEAGLSGHTWGGVCEVKLLWVEESRRRSGLGRRLLQAAAAEARGRGCVKMVLCTHSFQAPDFYQRQGFKQSGSFSDYPSGHDQLFLEKTL